MPLFVLAAAVSFHDFAEDAAQSLPAQLSDRTRNHARDYAVCVLDAARELEPSGEPARDVALAALASCGAEKTKVEAALYVDCSGVFGPKCPASVKEDEILHSLDAKIAVGTMRDTMEHRAQGK